MHMVNHLLLTSQGSGRRMKAEMAAQVELTSANVEQAVLQFYGNSRNGASQVGELRLSCLLHQLIK